MKTFYLVGAAAAAAGMLAVPASAQQPYPYPYAQPAPQPYPGQPGYGYQQQSYGQPYGTSTNPIEQVINQLLGNRYNVSDRTAVSRCAGAAVAQAQAKYRPNTGYGQQYGQPYGQAYGYGQQHGYANAYAPMRVTSITSVQRRSNNSLSVTGLISSGAYAQPYGNAYGYQGQNYQGRGYADPRYAQSADIAFRCNVDYRGAVTGVRLNHSRTASRR